MNDSIRFKSLHWQHMRFDMRLCYTNCSCLLYSSLSVLLESYVEPYELTTIECYRSIQQRLCTCVRVYATTNFIPFKQTSNENALRLTVNLYCVCRIHLFIHSQSNLK